MVTTILGLGNSLCVDDIVKLTSQEQNTNTIEGLLLNPIDHLFPGGEYMDLKKLAGFAVTTLALNLSFLSDINAASVDVKCEALGRSRSEISVDGRGLPRGLYRARVQSGGVLKWSREFQRPIRGEVEFDFDSDRGDIQEGATAVSPTYIKNGTVAGKKLPEKLIKYIINHGLSPE
jgi:hypothetical protein